MAQQMVLFLLGSEEYGIPISQVKELIHYVGATQLPQAPDAVEGVINLRGNVVPVVELARRLGMSAGSEEKKAIIVETGGQVIGILVDEVTEVITLQDTAIEPVPVSASANDYISGIGKVSDRLLILLNVDKLFSASEFADIGIIN